MPLSAPMIQLAAVLATGASHMPMSGRSIDSDVIVLAAPARLTSVRPEPVEGLSLSSDCGLEGPCFERLSTNGFPVPLQLPTNQEPATPILIAPPAPTPQQIALASFFAAAAPPDPIVRRLAMIDRPRRRPRDRRQMLARVDLAPPRPPVPFAPPSAPEAPPPAPVMPAALSGLQPIAFRPIRLAFAGAPPNGGPDPLRTSSDSPPLEVAALATPAAVAAMPTQAEMQSAPAPEAVPPLPPPPLVEDPNNPENAAPPALSGDADKAVLDDRRRPGVERPLPERVTQDNPGAVRAPPPEAFGSKEFPIPDRWRLIQSLGLVKENLLDPYHQNTLKGDRPLCHATPEEQERREEAHIPKCVTPGFLKGDDWFIALNATSDTVVEPRTFPIPTGIQYPSRPGQNDVFGKDTSFAFAQTFIVGASLIKGDTTFMPPEIEYRLVLAYQNNFARVPERRVLYVDPTKGRSRWDSFLGVQEAFIDYHIKNTSDRYDFYSVRVGIQPFNLDFRGFLFNDQTLGVRLFGNRDNNRFQWNVAGLWRIEKDTNSGLNDLGQPLRKDWVLFANAYRQDFPMPGLTSEAIVAWNINREGDDKYIDKNGFPVRPALIGNLQGRNYDVVYLGYGAEGRFGRFNLSLQTYAAIGKDSNNPFTGQRANIRGFFAAAEPSYDMDWVRIRGAALWQSGDKNAFSSTETGFDSIQENPIFAGADTSYWIRQAVPFIGGGRQITLTGRNGLLIDLRSSKDEGQSNFINPGEKLLGVGADFDLLPQLRVSGNANHLWFGTTKVLQTLRSEGSIPTDIGWDLSTAVIYRPKMNQNLVFRLSGAMLVPGAGFRDLFTNRDRNKQYYSILFNAILNY